MVIFNILSFLFFMNFIINILFYLLHLLFLCKNLFTLQDKRKQLSFLE